MVLTPAPPRPSGPDRVLNLRPGPDPDPGLEPDPVRTLTRPGAAPRPRPALPGPRPPGTAGEPDGVITRRVRPRRWRRRQRAVPAAVLAAVLAATVWAGVLIWRASPAAPNRAQPSRSHAVLHAAPGPPSPALSHPRPAQAPAPAASGSLSPAVSRPPSRAQALQPRAVIHMARARQQSRRQRTAQAAADTITAAGGGTAVGLHLRGHPGTAHPQPGPPRLPGPDPGPADWIALPGTGYTTNSSSYMVALWTSQVYYGDPAYIAANAYQLGAAYLSVPGDGGTTSTDGGRTWTSGTPVTLPAASPQSLRSPPTPAPSTTAPVSSAGPVPRRPTRRSRAPPRSASAHAPAPRPTRPCRRAWLPAPARAMHR